MRARILMVVRQENLQVEAAPFNKTAMLFAKSDSWVSTRDRDGHGRSDAIGVCIPTWV